MKTSHSLTLLAALTVTVLAACHPQTLSVPVPTVPAGVSAASKNAVATETLVPGRLLVKFKPSRGNAQHEALLRQYGLQRARSVGGTLVGAAEAFTTQGDAEKIARDLNKNPEVAYAEPVFTLPFPRVQTGDEPPISDDARLPNDPLFEKQYAHKITQTPASWAANPGHPRVVLAIVDSGVDAGHPDLKAKIVGAYNSADGNAEVKDFVGHGTHVAGIAAALTNNQIGVAGVAPECSILAVKVAPGSSTAPSTEGIARGILYSLEKGAQVINLSLGSRRESMAITDAVKQALARNVVVVVAMGNDAGNIKSWPAAVPGVIAVGSTDARDQRSRFSNYGDWISVTAPGSDILSTFPFNSNMIGQKEYGSISGTSMAAPFVTGLAGLIRSKYPNLPAAEVKRVIEASSEDLGKPGFDPEFGFGRVHAARALSRASELDAAARR
jgi:thermitase